MDQDELSDAEFYQLMTEDESQNEDQKPDSQEDELLDEMDAQTLAELEQEQVQEANLLCRTWLEKALAQRRFVIDYDTCVETVKRLKCTVFDCHGCCEEETVQPAPQQPMAGIMFQFHCTNGHIQYWSTTKKYGGRSLMGQLWVLIILFSGLTYSQVARAARFAHLAIPSASSFYQLQKIFCLPLREYYEKAMEKFRAISPGRVVAVDTRFDSPGHCASKSTTAFMDVESGLIIHCEFGDHRATQRQAAKMEKLNVALGLHHVTFFYPQCAEIVSDASSTIRSLLEGEEYATVRHSLDVWHKSKHLAKRKFFSNPMLLSSFVYYTHGRETSQLENFFSHSLLLYCPKRLAFSFDIYMARNQLAVIDFNHHKNRPVRTGANDAPYLQCPLSRRTKEWVAFQDLVQKDYSYMPELLHLCIDHAYGLRFDEGMNSTKSDYLDMVGAQQRVNPGAWKVFMKQKRRGEMKGRNIMFTTNVKTSGHLFNTEHTENPVWLEQHSET